MVRFRGVPRTRVKYEPRYKTKRQPVGAATKSTVLARSVRRAMDAYQKLHSDPDKMPMRGRTLWTAYYGGQQVSIRASAVSPHQTIRRMLIEHLGYNPGEIMLVQAGGLGQYYDEADSQCEVDIDLLHEDEQTESSP